MRFQRLSFSLTPAASRSRKAWLCQTIVPTYCLHRHMRVSSVPAGRPGFFPRYDPYFLPLFGCRQRGCTHFLGPIPPYVAVCVVHRQCIGESRGRFEETIDCRLADDVRGSVLPRNVQDFGMPQYHGTSRAVAIKRLGIDLDLLNDGIGITSRIAHC